MSTKETIHYNSNESAQYKTVKGWVSRDGYFYGDKEHLARWAGCTHKDCEDCGAVTDKRYTVCKSCREKRADDRFNALPQIEWDGKFPIYSNSSDKHFWCEQELYEYVYDELELDWNSQNVTNLQLQPCRPQYLRQIDTDYWGEEAPEDDWEFLPDEVSELVDKLNEAIRKAGPVSWVAVNKRFSDEALVKIVEVWC